jgi:multiple sugar transport system permease protein
MRLRRRPRTAQPHQGFVTASDWQRPAVRWGLGAALWLLLIGLVIVGLGPLLWLAKSAITPTTDTITHPIALFPHGTAWGNLHEAWSRVHVDRYFWNTVQLAIGSWFVQIVVATTGGFALSVLRPKYAKVLTGLVLVTLFVPVVVLLVPLYVEIVHPPLIHHSFIDSYWAIWLPAGASAFNVILVTRFFDNLPREIFEAARVDGADPFRLFWFVVLPMSKPILGVVSVFAILASWKDFLWPLLVLTNPDKQPLSVRLPTIQSQTELGVFLAALFIACLVPIIGFLIFQRSFLRGSGLGGAIKG